MARPLRTARNALFVGRTGSGKTTAAREYISAWSPHDLVMVWDMKGEYGQTSTGNHRPGWVNAHTNAELFNAVTNLRGRVAFIAAAPGQFDYFCRVAHAAASGAARVCVVVEELADVTSPAKAPDSWGIIVRRGRARGMTVVAVTQRPQESDKTILGNRTHLWCGALPSDRDAEYMGRQLGVPREKIMSMPEYAAWVQHDFSPPKLIYGKKTKKHTRP